MGTTAFSRRTTCSACGRMRAASSTIWSMRATSSRSAKSDMATTRWSSGWTRAMRCPIWAWTVISVHPKRVWRANWQNVSSARPMRSSRSTSCGAPCLPSATRTTPRSPANAFRKSPKKTCCTSSRRTRRCWSRGSARSSASCARSRSISIRSARPR
ncbi:hypothetical protein SDC9_121656 [bioreactor metagenome]|uniref:Uncharacterized protein n=1 Tax=bioreactor metagenome TaxID=1076179 RepID=A0A645CCJ9_9ZZZZ